MTNLRLVGTTLAAFVVSQLLAVAVHGFLLANDYAPFYGTLLRSGPAWPMLLLPVAHLCFISGLVWMYSRLSLTGATVVQGIKIGTLGWVVGQAPLWLLWFAEQPWPGSLVLKQLGLEWGSSLIIGLTIALVGGQPARRATRPLTDASSVGVGS